jgi:hypothetical protein
MVYVDLNPVRAGIAADLRMSHYTSVQRRWRNSLSGGDRPVAAMAGVPMVGFLPLSEHGYLRLVEWTGRQMHAHKRGVIAVGAPPLPFGEDMRDWTRRVRGIESIYCRAIGAADALLEKARAIGQRWLMVRRVERVCI